MPVTNLRFFSRPGCAYSRVRSLIITGDQPSAVRRKVRIQRSSFTAARHCLNYPPYFNTDAQIPRSTTNQKRKFVTAITSTTMALCDSLQWGSDLHGRQSHVDSANSCLHARRAPGRQRDHIDSPSQGIGSRPVLQCRRSTPAGRPVYQTPPQTAR